VQFIVCQLYLDKATNILKMKSTDNSWSFYWLKDTHFKSGLTYAFHRHVIYKERPWRPGDTFLNYRKKNSPILFLHVLSLKTSRRVKNSNIFLCSEIME